MLKYTFRHLKGISKKKEQNLWRKGVFSWDDYKAYAGEQLTIFGANDSDHELLESEEAYEKSNVAFFGRQLDASEYYRIALEYPNDVLFLDIETTGLSLYYDQITIVGWSIGKNFGVYVNGESASHLLSDLESAKVIVTFNGTLFDLKFLLKHFDEIQLPPVHLDLRYFSKRVGFTGGQKIIEKQLGFYREKDVEDMMGEAAPILWHKYRRGEKSALKRLIEYNHADVEGMKAILDESITRFYELDGIPKRLRRKPPFSKKSSSIKWLRKRSGAANSYSIYIDEFKGNAKPLITYSGLNRICNLDKFCVVGIDLVSSEERETGFCALKGNGAETARLKTDEDLINATISCGAKLVSIDSPLSIPKGRASYFDDDPNRGYGITRVCERTLKKRGINSYPALIPSMQKLTRRGVELAKKFRKAGIPVIESYPGAAQDIMCIPRKQAGLDYLIDGLSEFGIEGSYTSGGVSHDELDAITSAIVGQFYWAGMYEALGDDLENYLIVPDLNAAPSPWLGKKVILLSGNIASGKTTVADYLSKKGFISARYSKVLEEFLKAEGKPISRSSLQEVGARVHKEKGQRWLGDRLKKHVGDATHIVIDGVRFLEDLSYMKETYGPACLHIHIAAAKDVRSRRVVDVEREDVDIRISELSETEREIDRLADMADLLVRNCSSKSELFRKVDKALKGV